MTVITRYNRISWSTTFVDHDISLYDFPPFADGRHHCGSERAQSPDAGDQRMSVRYGVAHEEGDLD